MQEIYQLAADIYKDLVDKPPTDPALCSCANDVTANGILKEVVNIARQLKYRARGAQANCLSSRGVTTVTMNMAAAVMATAPIATIPPALPPVL